MKGNVGSLAILIIAVPYLFWLGRGLPWTLAHLAGLFLMPAGIIFLVVARIQLGRAFSVQAKALQLVTTGLYAHLRSPIYTFGGVAIAGGILWFDRPVFLLIFLFLIPIQVWRTHEEAKVLRERFGDLYDEYCKGTWF
jgi:protein-S-isoprenylcysteine O-methyltransferase Ste14